MVELDKQTDDELMKQAKHGSAEAFDLLVRRHQRALLGIACRMLGDLEPAKDAVQNTFLELYRLLPRYRALGKLPSLLRRILLNQCRITWRQQRSRLRMNQLMIEMKQTSTQTKENTLQHEDRAALQYALALVCSKYRNVVQLRFGLGLSYQEIAEWLDIPIGTVKSRLWGGLSHMRNILETSERKPLRLFAA